jgi:hypothetical protein
MEYHRGEPGDGGLIQLRSRLVERGRKYVQFCTPEPSMLQCEYQGTALTSVSALHRMSSKGLSENRNEDVGSGNEEEVDVTTVDITRQRNRVIIDNLFFMRSARNKSKRGNTLSLGEKLSSLELDGTICGICDLSAIQLWKPSPNFTQSTVELGQAIAENEERLRFLPPRLLGYALKEKIWGQFFVDKLTHINPVIEKRQKGPFWDELELEDESKRHLMALVQHRRASRLRKPGQRTGDDCTSDWLYTAGRFCCRFWG